MKGTISSRRERNSLRKNEKGTVVGIRSRKILHHSLRETHVPVIIAQGPIKADHCVRKALTIISPCKLKANATKVNEVASINKIRKFITSMIRCTSLEASFLIALHMIIEVTSKEPIPVVSTGLFLQVIPKEVTGCWVCAAIDRREDPFFKVSLLNSSMNRLDVN